jgi:hypothetical protein
VKPYRISGSSDDITSGQTATGLTAWVWRIVNMNDEMTLLMAGLFLIGMIVSLTQARTFAAKTRESMRIERSGVSQTMRWIVASGLWSGFFMALTLILIVRGNQDVNLSAWGVAAILLSITIVWTALTVAGFLLEVLQLRTFVLPAMRERARKNSSEETVDVNNL